MDLQDKRVLVVEDNWAIGDQVSHLIEEEGGKILGPLPSAASAIKAVGAEELDGAVLDVQLRDGSALPVANLLRARSVPFVVISGFEQIRVPDAMRHAPFVPKPIVEQALIDVVRRTFVQQYVAAETPLRRSDPLVSRLCLELGALTGDARCWVMLDIFPRRLRTSWREIDLAAILAEQNGWLVRRQYAVRLTPAGRQHALDLKAHLADLGLVLPR